MARVREGLVLVEIIARQLRRELGPSVELDELVSQGREGLLSAARSFDPDRGVPFRRWANLRVRGAMIDGVRAQTALPRRVYRQLRAIEAGDRVADAMHEEDAAAPATTAKAADERLGAYLSNIATAMALGVQSTPDGELVAAHGSEEPTAEERLAREELLRCVRSNIAELPDDERRLVERHYFDDVTFEEAARELGLSKSWASRLHARAIERVTRGLRRQRIV
jgi:RNA polymerase sigma factor for flagellar operon FliA